ncbi:hypothetical protein PAPYR_11864 [Paratrimastix pyriformis]|uniref:Uncharacterized protein n=1 Tax=Paratrimastix pyriformis TaxID=342808 RepID=A0ABQ8U2Z6_9EUKA|nr:hypothetical protein PAPYR_11864 [Paratrimastix pyriformis]
MPKESTQELRETRSGRRYRLLVTRGMTPRRRNREAIRGVRALNPNEAEQEETQRASQEHEATEQEQEEIQHASQDADQHHPQRTCAGERATEPPTAEPEAPEPEQTTVPEQTTEPVPEQTTIEPLETTTTEPEVTTSDPVQATTTEPAEPSEPEPAQSELQQTGTEPEAAEQSVPGEPEQLAEPEQPAEPELTPNPSRPQPLLRRPQSSPPTPDRPSVVVACPSSETEGGFASQETARLHPAQDASTGPRLSRAFTAAAGCWFNRCSQDASASGIRAFQNPRAAPVASGSGSGFRASQNPTCSPGHRHEHDCHASSSGSGSGFRASQNPRAAPVTATSTTKASSSGSGSSFRASQNAHRHEFHVISPSHNFESSSASVVVEHRPPPSIGSTSSGNRRQSVETHSTGILRTDLSQAACKLVPEHKPSESRSHRPCSFFETMAEYRLSGAICVEMHKVLNRLGLTFGKILFSMTCGQSADIEKTYQFLTSRALMILVSGFRGCIRRRPCRRWPHEGWMSLPSGTHFYVSSQRYSRLANVNTSLSPKTRRKTYDWSIQCHKFTPTPATARFRPIGTVSSSSLGTHKQPETFCLYLSPPPSSAFHTVDLLFDHNFYLVRNPSAVRSPRNVCQP